MCNAPVEVSAIRAFIPAHTPAAEESACSNSNPAIFVSFAILVLLFLILIAGNVASVTLNLRAGDASPIPTFPMYVP